MNKKTYFINTLTPTHVGGSEQISIIDLPIQREKHTNFPKFEGSSLKGALRSAFLKETDEQKTNLLFGTDSEETDKASAIGFTDARTLFFPVKSAKGVFAWITCPAVLHKFINETGFGSELQDQIKANTAPTGSSLFVKDSNIILEEYTFQLEKSSAWKDFLQKISTIIFEEKSQDYLRNKFEKDTVIIDDDSFRDFVVHSTEVRTRIKINQETRIVNTGGLFNEEYLPEETILYFLVVAHPPPEIKKDEQEILKEFSIMDNKIIQIGANITLGKGFVKLKAWEG